MSPSPKAGPPIEQIGALLRIKAPFVPLQGGRTNHLWRAGDLVVKVYESSAQTPLFGNDASAEHAALSALKGLNIAPAPQRLAAVAGYQVLIYHALDRAADSIDPHAAGMLLARLHGLKPPKGLAKAEIGADILKRAEQIGGQQAPSWIAPPDTPPTRCFVHRDPIAANFVPTSKGLFLIDWQCPGLGDPLEDIAHFLSPAMRVVYGQTPLSDAGQTAFWDGYADPETQARYRAFGAAFHWRMAAYCHWQTARGAQIYEQGAQAEQKLIVALHTQLENSAQTSQLQKKPQQEVTNGA